ncbi:hypothetical protein ACFWUU_38110 [Kribbella sp. NPDC058693]|uniref:hypothetical protein n=1 Tax=Kribbella sp. NPDC058693 TaxID=3346602 RepID=UPI003651EC42
MPKAVPLAAVDDSVVYGAYGISLLAAAGAGTAVVVSSRSARKRQQEADELRQITEQRRADELQRLDQARKQLATCMGAVQTLVSARRQNAEADVMAKVGEAHQAIAELRVGNVLDSLPSWRRHLSELERAMDEVVKAPVTRSRQALVDFNLAASVLIDQLDTWQAGRTAA